MFDKLKQLGELNKMRQQASALQKELEKITETMEKNGWSVSVTGDQKIRYIKKDGEDMKFLVDLINEAMKKVQKEAAKKMMEMGGGLSGLLGGLGK
ncbi:MAG: YbaB/EbfC family nucleoid-associated protein [Candidatus Woesebacteria bacterium]|nr:YbaB/EbfC family nucleoid-associated protein [Candidatus Woesebacteria bacterium]